MQHLLAPGIGFLVSFEAENTPWTEEMALTGERLVEGLLQSGRRCRGAPTPHRLADAFVHVDDRPCFHSITITAFPVFAKPFRKRSTWLSRQGARRGIAVHAFHPGQHRLRSAPAGCMMQTRQGSFRRRRWALIDLSILSGFGASPSVSCRAPAPNHRHDPAPPQGTSPFLRSHLVRLFTIPRSTRSSDRR